MTAVATPQAEDFGLWTVRHINNAFEPPAFNDSTANCTQDQSVLPHLQEAQISTGVRTDLNGETVPVHLTRCKRFQIDIVSFLLINYSNP